MFCSKFGKEVKNKFSNKKMNVVVLMIIVIILGSIYGFYKNNEKTSISENISSSTTENIEKTETINTQKETSITEKCDTSSTGYVFNKYLSDMQTDILSCINTTFSDASNFSTEILDAKDSFTDLIPEASYAYDITIKMGDKIYFHVGIDRETFTEKISSVSIYYVEQDDGMYDYCMQKKDIILQELAKQLDIETEYNNFARSLPRYVDNYMYNENNIYFSYYGYKGSSSWNIQPGYKEPDYTAYGYEDDKEPPMYQINVNDRTVEVNENVYKILTEIYSKYPKAQYVIFYSNFENSCWLLNEEGRKVHVKDIPTFEKALEVCNIDINSATKQNY